MLVRLAESRGGPAHPRAGEGMGPARYELSRSDDEGDRGRGRSEAKPNGVPTMTQPANNVEQKKKVTFKSYDFLVTLFIYDVVCDEAVASL